MLDTLCMWHPHKNMKSLNLTNVTKINHLHIILMLFSCNVKIKKLKKKESKLQISCFHLLFLIIHIKIKI